MAGEESPLGTLARNLELYIHTIPDDEPVMEDVFCELVRSTRKARLPPEYRAKLAEVNLTQLEGALACMERPPHWLQETIFLPDQKTPRKRADSATLRLIVTEAEGYADKWEGLAFLLTETTRRAQPTSPESTSTPLKRLAASFEGEYKGRAAWAFSLALDGFYTPLYDARRHYGRTICLIQSSGCGKSRMVKQLGLNIPLVSFCLRSSDSTGFPPGDTPICNFFSTHAQDRSGEELAAALLGGLFSTVNAYIKARPSNTSVPEMLGELHYRYSEETEGVDRKRTDFLEEVVGKAEKRLKDQDKELLKIKCLVAGIKDRNRTLQNESEKETKATTSSRYVNALCREDGELLASTLGDHKFMLALDEATWLNANSRSLMSFQRIWKSVSQCAELTRFWLILLDTNSQFLDLAPNAASEDTSRRFVQLRFLPVWCYFGFDQQLHSIGMMDEETEYSEDMEDGEEMENGEEIEDGKEADDDDLSRGDRSDDGTLDARIEDGDSDEGDVEEPWVGSLAKMGRPLWDSIDTNAVIRLAVSKLFNTDTPQWDRVQHVLAYYSHRIGLGLGGAFKAETSLIAGDAVARHMRIFAGVRANKYIQTVTLSEPILSIASIVAINEHKDSVHEALSTLVDQLIFAIEAIDQGDRGELLCRLIITTARDKQLRSWKPCDGNLVVPTVTLEQMLIDLLGPTACSTAISQLQDRNLAGGKVNFTHIVTLPKHVDELSQAFLRHAWQRTVAFQCASGQPGIDLFFVVKVQTKYSIVAVQSKLQVRAETTQAGYKGHYLAPWVINGPSGERSQPPLTLLMQLGVIRSARQRRGWIKVSPQTSVSFIKKAQVKKGIWATFNTVLVSVRGFRRASYPCLDGLSNDLLERLFECTGKAPPNDRLVGKEYVQQVNSSWPYF